MTALAFFSSPHVLDFHLLSGTGCDGDHPLGRSVAYMGTSKVSSVPSVVRVVVRGERFCLLTSRTLHGGTTGHVEFGRYLTHACCFIGGRREIAMT